MKKGRGLNSKEIPLCSLKGVGWWTFRRSGSSLVPLCCNQDMAAHLSGTTLVNVYLLGMWSPENRGETPRLDPVAHKCNTGSVFLLREIKHHIKTQYILERKDKDTKRACLIFRNAILSFASSAIQLAKLLSFFKSWRLYPNLIFCYFQGLSLQVRLSLCTCVSLNSHTSVNSGSRNPGPQRED